MMVDTTIYGYIDDGGVTCIKCLQDGLDNGSPIPLSENAGALYYLEDDGRGLTCDNCSEYIFEPSDDYCSDCDDFHEDVEDEHRADHHEDGARKYGEGTYTTRDDEGPLDCELCEAEAEAERAAGYSSKPSPGQLPLA